MPKKKSKKKSKKGGTKTAMRIKSRKAPVYKKKA
jgi:hypothetical protein